MNSAAHLLRGHIAALESIRKMQKQNHVRIGLTLYVGLGGNEPSTRVQVTDGGAEILGAIENGLLDTMTLTALLTRTELTQAEQSLELYSKVEGRRS